MLTGKKIYIAGHKGMVGSAIWNFLEKRGYNNLIGRESSVLDLKVQADVEKFMITEKPDIVIDAAAKVGGILANSSFPYQFIMHNMQIQNNLIDSALKSGVEKFIFLGSSCIYPKLAPQPIKEEYLMTDSLESTNEWYALAKISGIKACQAIREQFGKDYVSFMPANLYGANDNFDLNTSHVLPAMIRKFHDAKVNSLSKNKTMPVILWGSGNPLREFLYVEDLAEAVYFAIQSKLPDHLYNVGTGVDITIRGLAEMIKKIVGYDGEISWDDSKPDGTPRKVMDVNKMHNLGWKHKVELQEGIERTYRWYLENIDKIKKNKL
jgi:GDP-L-fucose synthase